MTVYSAPINEVEFVINKLAGMDQLAKLPGFEEVSSDLIQAILEEASKLANEVLAPLNKTGDTNGAKIVDGNVITTPGFSEAYTQFVENGWLSLAQPTEHEGQGLPFLLHMAVSEFWNSANMAFALCPMLTVGAIDALKAHASPEIKSKYLPNMVSGKWTGTMNLTEPQAGSDLAAVTAKAIPNGDHYLISGTKIFITWGEHDMAENIMHLVLARLPDAPEGVKGISLFIVPKFLINDDGSLGERNDAKVVSIEHKLGINASPTCVMSFGDGKGAVGYLIGEENNGLACMFTMMNHARLEVGLEGVGISERAYQAAADYAKERKQGNKSGHEGRVAIIEHADVRRMLLVMRALTEASRAISYVAAAAMDHAHNNPDADTAKRYKTRMDVLTPIVKAWSTEIVNEITSLAIQVYGGMGFVEESGVAQHYRDARITAIYEGTNGIQANDLIGRKLIRDNGAGMQALIEDIRQVQAELIKSGDKELATIGKQLENAISIQEESANYVLKNYKSDQDMAPAAAFNFMMLSGTVTGAWQMAVAALAAKSMLDNNEGDANFAKAKIITTQFYMTHILPRAVSYKQMVEAGQEVVMSMPVDSF